MSNLQMGANIEEQARGPSLWKRRLAAQLRARPRTLRVDPLSALAHRASARRGPQLHTAFTGWSGEHEDTLVWLIADAPRLYDSKLHKTFCINVGACPDPDAPALDESEGDEDEDYDY